jgi:hypothetical protein
MGTGPMNITILKSPEPPDTTAATTKIITPEKTKKKPIKSILKLLENVLDLSK